MHFFDDLNFFGWLSIYSLLNFYLFNSVLAVSFCSQEKCFSFLQFYCNKENDALRDFLLLSIFCLFAQIFFLAFIFKVHDGANKNELQKKTPKKDLQNLYMCMHFSRALLKHSMLHWRKGWDLAACIFAWGDALMVSTKCVPITSSKYNAQK